MAMAILSFSLSPEATGRVYELLVCLAKFGESISLEAKTEKARQGALVNMASPLTISTAHDYRSQPI